MHTSPIPTSTHTAPAPVPPHDGGPAPLIRRTGPLYFPVALMARLPFAMMVVGVLTLVVAARGSLAIGGLTSAMIGLGTAIFGPLLGAAADRFGQRAMLLVAGTANSLLLVAMAWIVYTDVPNATLLTLSFMIGATMPQVAPLSRSRLVGIIDRYVPLARREKVLGGTMAYESAADEIVFVFGPVVVGLLGTTMNPAAPVIGAAVLALIFVTSFALHPTARAARAATGESGELLQAPASQLASLRVLVTVIGTLGMGLFFGAMLTSLTAFMAERGAPEQAGLVYGAMGVGSAALALGVALFPTRFTLRARWLTFAGILVAGTLLLPFVDTIGGMSVALLLIGIGIGPTLVTQYSLAAERSPQGRSSTVMTMLGSAVIVGQAGASAIVGILAESHGADVALLAPIVAGSVVLVAGIINALLPRR